LLISIFPTPHEGGPLLLRQGGRAWSFDYGPELGAARKPSIGTLHFEAVGHEVMLVISGHRVLLTYGLHLDDGEPASGNDAAPELFTPLPNERAFYRAFEELLENLEFRNT